MNEDLNLSARSLELWKLLMQRVEAHFNSQAKDHWFSKLKPIGLDRDMYRIIVPNSFIKDWLDRYYRSWMEGILLNHTGMKIAVQFEVKDNQKPIIEEIEASPELVEEHSTPQPISNISQRYTFANFIENDNNQLALAAANHIAAKRHIIGTSPLYIYGPSGVGKTHLLNAIANARLEQFPADSILYITAEQFVNQVIQGMQNHTMQQVRQKFRTIDLLLVDDIQYLNGKMGMQEEFCHTINDLYYECKAIVLTADKLPEEIQKISDRLVSRFRWGIIADISHPTDDTRLTILLKHAEYYKIDIPPDVAEFIAIELVHSVRELEGAIAKLALHAKICGQPVTLEFAKKLFENHRSNGLHKPSSVTLQDILHAVAKFYNITVNEILANKKLPKLALARQIFMYLSRELTDSSLKEIALMVKRDHTTVLYGCRRIADLIQVDNDVANQINTIKRTIQSHIIS